MSVVRHNEVGTRLHVDKCSPNGHVKGLMAYFGFEEKEGEDHGDTILATLQHG